MSALLVKDTPEALHQWLRNEAAFNRRSVNQQVLICLEWCMQTYGAARPRNPFGERTIPSRGNPDEGSCARGRELRNRLMALGPIDAATAAQMKKAARSLRRMKKREFEYACFD